MTASSFSSGGKTFIRQKRIQESSEMFGGLLVLFVTFVGVVYVCFIGPSRAQVVEHQRQLVERAFESQSKKRPSLASAKLVRQKEVVSGENAVTVHTDRIYKCLDGTYLLFICTSGEPGYVTELSSERAKNALRSTPTILAEEFPNETGA